MTFDVRIARSEHYPTTSMYKAIVFAVAVVFLLIRPGVLSCMERGNMVALVLIVALTALYLSVVGKVMEINPLCPKTAPFLALCTVFFAYLLTDDILHGYHDAGKLKNAIAFYTVALCSSIILADSVTNHLVFNKIYQILVVFSWLAVIHVLLTAVIPLGSLRIATIISRGTDRFIYFPGVITSGGIPAALGPFAFGRINTPFTESGIAQAFYCWALVYANRYRKPLRSSIVLVLAIFLTRSPLGYGNLIATVAMLCFMAPRKMARRAYMGGACVVAAAMIAFIAMPRGSYEDRMASGGSGETRFSSNASGLNYALRGASPLLGEKEPSDKNDSENYTLIGRIRYNGLIGVGLSLLPLIVPMLLMPGKSLIAFAGMFALLFSLLAGQALFAAPLLYTMVLYRWEDCEVTAPSRWWRFA